MVITIKEYFSQHKQFNPMATKEEMRKEGWDRSESSGNLRQVEEELDLFNARLQQDPENKYLMRMVNYLKREYNGGLKTHFQGLKGKFDEPEDAGLEVQGELVEEAEKSSDENPEPEEQDNKFPKGKFFLDKIEEPKTEEE